MLKLNTKTGPVEAVLRMDMVIAGENCAAGEVVEFNAREFKYLEQYDRVLVATKENVAIVRAEAEKKAAKVKADAVKADALADTKNQLAAALARIAELEKKAK